MMNALSEFDLATTDFVVADIGQTMSKINQIQHEGPASLRAHLDLDKTFIVDSLWTLMRAGLDEDRRRRHEELSETFVPLLDKNTLTPEQAAEWQEEAVKLLVGSSVMRMETETRKAKARKGAFGFMKICGLRGVTKIMQTATTDIAASSALRANCLNVSILSATRLLQEDGIITGYDPATLTTDLDKGRIMTPELVETVEERKNAIVVGDRRLDTLLSDDPNALRVREGKVDFGNVEATKRYLEESFGTDPRFPHAFDAVAIHDDLFSVAALADLITHRPGRRAPRRPRFLELGCVLRAIGSK